MQLAELSRHDGGSIACAPRRRAWCWRWCRTSRTRTTPRSCAGSVLRARARLRIAAVRLRRQRGARARRGADADASHVRRRGLHGPVHDAAHGQRRGVRPAVGGLLRIRAGCADPARQHRPSPRGQGRGAVLAGQGPPPHRADQQRRALPLRTAAARRLSRRPARRRPARACRRTSRSSAASSTRSANWPRAGCWRSSRRRRAVFAVSDTLAVGAIKARLRGGPAVCPEDLAVVGFDDVPLASIFEPSLTTDRAAAARARRTGDAAAAAADGR